LERLLKHDSIRNALDNLRRAYSEGDAKELHDAYANAGANSRFLRVALPSLERVYPLKRFLGLAARLEASMAEHGLHSGCQRFFEELSITWDFRLFSTKYVCNLLPSVGAASFPMEVPLTRSWTEWRRSGWQRALVYRLISLVHDMPSTEEIRAGNRSSLIAGAEYIRQGGSAIICPGGGGNRKDRKWYAGIGSLVKQLQQFPGERTVYLLPFREENCSNKRIYAYIQNGPLSRFKNAFMYRGPIRIRFAEPIPISDIGQPEFTAQQVVELLKSYYESLFLEPAIASI